LARSTKWISTSIQKDRENEGLAVKASPAHFVNNFRSPVLFYDALKEIPVGATVVEIGPSGLLAGLIRKGTINANVISLQKRGSENGILDLISALGRLFIAGVTMDVNKLGGEAGNGVYPVPLGTPMISPLIQWDHTQPWDVPQYGHNVEFLEGIYEVDTRREMDSYLKGHCIEGRILFPATGYLVLAWKFFAEKYQKDMATCPVVFEDVKYHRITLLHESGTAEFRVSISDASGSFEIMDGKSVVVTGIIRAPDTNAEEFFVTEQNFSQITEEEGSRAFDGMYQTENDFYKQFRRLGYEYTGAFKGIIKRNMEGKARRTLDQPLRVC
jgi:fatty acid synthase